jgi:hypothetical protein
MSVGHHKPVTVNPLWVGGVVVQEVVVQHFGDVGHAHGRTRMSRVGLLNGIHGKDSDGIGIKFSISHDYNLVWGLNNEWKKHILMGLLF